MQRWSSTQPSGAGTRVGHEEAHVPLSYIWHFNTLRPCDKRREPIQGEFFAAEAIERPGEALVREGIQNSLDARHDYAKVMVRIRVQGVEKPVARATVERFMDGLGVHLSAPGNGLQDVPQDDEACQFLVFEDFGTTGLIGDPAAYDPPAEGTENHFYFFFRAEGRTDKGENDLGSWGVGKQVFPRASRINSIFGLTIRADDQKQLLMGMSVLKSHKVGDTTYSPDGWLGRRSEEGEAGLILPIDDTDFISQFVRTFDLQRGNEPGLSVVVPWCEADLSEENLIRAVLSHYFWPVLRDQLEVWIETSSFETILDAGSLKNELTKIGGELKEELLPLIELAEWAQRRGDSQRIHLQPVAATADWGWTRDLFPEDCLPNAQQSFSRGEMIAVRVPLSIAKVGSDPTETYFDVYLVREDTTFSGIPVYIRDGIVIPEVRRRGGRGLRGVRSIVVAEDRPVAAFLGDAENPAHTEWQSTGSNFKNKYQDGPRILDFIIRSVSGIVSAISQPDEKVDPDLLRDVFFLPPAAPETPAPRPQPAEKPGEGPDIPEPPPRTPQPFTITRVPGGFAVSPGDSADGHAGCELVVRAAYDTRRGNPFRRYDPADFDFENDIEVTVEGAEVLSTGPNEIRVRTADADFSIRVTGFDPRRDVRAEVRRIEEGDGAPFA